MTLPIKIVTAGLILLATTGTTETKNPARIPAAFPSKNKSPKIQAAILLDVSNSMDGLIEQAKSQLWNMVSVMGRAKCDGQVPGIEIALYEYGSPRNEEIKGFVRQISPFTTDLDGLSAKLFALTTNGGNEYCGQAIYSSIDELAWDTSSLNYKVIFIAGNEDFLQGSVHYTKACNAAKMKGVIVNTIYCGDRMQGIKEHWNLQGECGNGTFTNIDQGIREEYIPTPYDSTILVLNTRLNGTYMAFGVSGADNISRQNMMDSKNMSASKATALKRVEVKGNSSLYNNSGWDMIDASTDDSTFIEKMDLKYLPDSLKNKSRTELKKMVAAKKRERIAIQNQITVLSDQRSRFLAEEKKKRAATNNQSSLQTETEKIIVSQAKRYNMLIK